MTSASKTPHDPYDDRHLQRKALERWERQRQAWQQMRQTLLQRTGHGHPNEGTCNTLSLATTQSREKREDLSIIHTAVPPSALASYYVWESLLRRDAESCGLRHVQVGKGYYPYALYSEMHDQTGLKPSHPVFTRIVTEDHVEADNTALAARSAAREALRRRIAKHQERRRQPRATVTAGDGKSNDASLAMSPGVRDKKRSDDVLDEATRLMQDEGDASSCGSEADVCDGEEEEDYYEHQLKEFAPYVEKRFAHFLLPRAFLHVEGRPAPRLTAEEASAAQSEPAEDAAVRYYVPRTLRLPSTPQLPQQPQIAPPSASHTTSTLPPTHEPDLGDELTARAVDRPPVGSARAVAETRLTAALSEVAQSESRLANATPRDEADVSSEQTESPTLLLSTRRLLFRAQPGELVHGHVTMSNLSAVTVYYTWIAVDPLAERFAEDAADADPTARAALASEDKTSRSLDERAANSRTMCDEKGQCGFGNDDDDGLTAGQLCVVRQTLHALAHHQNRARSYFYLSRPANGVLLPHTEERFPFSLRAPQAGRFQCSYELLTVPPSPTRLLVELDATVHLLEPSVTSLTTGLEAALQAKANADAQRQLVQQLVRQATPYDAADLECAIQTIHEDKEAVQTARATTHATRRHAWLRANSATYHDIPFNIAVYEKFMRLHDNLWRTLSSLRGVTPQTGSWAVWDGSLARLFGDLCELRDAAARTTLQDAFLALLRLAQVSQDEAEPLHLLLRRAAGALVLQVERDSLQQQRKEIKELQVPREPVLPVTPAVSVASGKKSRSASVNPRRGQAMAGGGANATSGAVATAAPLMRGAGGPPPPSLSGTMRPSPPTMMMMSAAATSSSPEEEEALRREHEVWMRSARAGLAAERPTRVAAIMNEWRSVIDAGCDLPLIDVVHASRAQDIATTQSAAEIEVDVSAGAAAAKPTKRK